MIIEPGLDVETTTQIGGLRRRAPAAVPDARTMLRVSVLLAAGAAPVLSISLYVFGLMPMTIAAACLVFPLAALAIILVIKGSPEAAWAARGFAAGLLAVTAYDTARLPLVWLNVWPDFIPRLGGWLIDSTTPNAPLGYLWRYVGDGGGIGVAFFVSCGVLIQFFPGLIISHPVRLATCYGIFVWTGLIATIAVAPRGEQLLFALTPASLGLSLLGHLIYGSVLGVSLRRHIRN